MYSSSKITILKKNKDHLLRRLRLLQKVPEFSELYFHKSVTIA